MSVKKVGAAGDWVGGRAAIGVDALANFTKGWPSSGAALLLAFALAPLPGCSGQARQLPRPEPMEVHAEGTLSSGQQRKLGDIRRFLGPQEQQLLERSIEDLAADKRLPNGAGDKALSRAIGRTGSNVARFCDRFVDELKPLMLTGPEASAPASVAFAVTTEEAYARWVSDATRASFASPLELGRAIRSGALDRSGFNASAPVGTPGLPLFLTDAAEFDKKSETGAAGLLCLPGKPAQSYVVAVIPIAKLGGPVRVPTAADGACRPRFQLPPQGATAGTTCTGRPEFVAATPTLGTVEEFRLSR